MLPIHVAALYGSTSCLGILISLMPSFTVSVDQFGRSCLHAAACSGLVFILPVLY